MNTEWKPIASAPENEGRPLFCELCWGPEGDQSVGTGFRHNGKWYAAGLFYCLGQEKRYELREVEVQPTHWKPQSDLPDEESAAPTSHPIPTGATGEDGEKIYHFEQRSRFGPWIEVEKPTAKSVEFVKRSDATPAGDSQDLTLAQKYEDACIAANANARDAERYRWLRDPKIDPALVLDKRTGYVPEDESVPGIGGYHTYEYRAGEELDAAIDAAIAQQKGEA